MLQVPGKPIPARLSDPAGAEHQSATVERQGSAGHRDQVLSHRLDPFPLDPASAFHQP
jgi:hypothetical protein